jgi:hypothetical protein
VELQPLGGRVFGKVDEYGGEFAASTFWHLWFLPLIPTGSVWICSKAGMAMAHPIRWHARSIAAAYLRTWAPIIWIFGLSADTSAGYAAAGIALAFCAWSWTWRMAHRRRAQLRSDFDLVALGSQCPPERLLHEEVQQLLARKHAAIAELSGGRSPEDIARFGSASVDELVAAYAVLRLVATQRPPSGPSRLAAQRIIDGRHDRLDHREGVFRARATSTGSRMTGERLVKVVRARALDLRARSVFAASRVPPTRFQDLLWDDTLCWLGKAALVLVAVFGGVLLRNIKDPDRFEIITARHLRDTIASEQTEYRVQCESLTPFVDAADSGAGKDVHLCELGGRYLPVLSAGGEGLRGTVVRGRLLRRDVFRPHKPQWEELLQASRYDDKAAAVYLMTNVFSNFGQIILALSHLLGAPLLLVLWIRVRRQRARMLAEAEAACMA